MTVILDRVPLSDLETVWPYVETYIQAGIDAVTTSETVENIKAEMLADRLGLWVIFETDTPLPFLGAAVTCMQETNHGLVAVIRFLSGRNGMRWIRPCLREFEEHAKASGATRVRINGRLGWRRYLRDYREASITLEKRL